MELDISDSTYFYRRFLRPDKILKYCLKTFWEMFKNKLWQEQAVLTAKSENLLCEHDTNNTECSERVQKWMHLLTFNEIFDLSFIQNLSEAQIHLSNDELLANATNLWFSLTEAEKQFHRQADNDDINVLSYKFHQPNWNLHLNSNEKQRNKYVEFLVDYYSSHSELSDEQAISNGSEQWQHLVDTSHPTALQHEDKIETVRDMPLKTNQKLRSYYPIYRVCTKYAFFIWGPTYQNFFYKYWSFRSTLLVDEALRESLFLWNIMTKEMKARFK